MKLFCSKVLSHCLHRGVEENYKQVKKSKYTITILTCLLGSDLRSLLMALSTSRFLMSLRGHMFSWGFPTHTYQCAETQVGLT
jgi:hypothetical protein